MGRTLDLASSGDWIDAWFLGLQFLLSKVGSSSMVTLPESTFVFRKVQNKIMDIAHADGLTMRTYVARRLKAMGADAAFQQSLKQLKEKDAAKQERKKAKTE